MVLLRTDMGIWGLCLSIVVVAQIYILLFVLHWCALQVKQISAQLHKLRQV